MMSTYQQSTNHSTKNSNNNSTNKNILPQQTWSSQQIVGLSQNDYHVRSSRSLAVASRWKSLAIDEQFIWGTIALKNTAGTIQIHTSSVNISKSNKATGPSASTKTASTKTTPTSSVTTSTVTTSTVPTLNDKKIIRTAIRLKDFQSSCTCVSHHSPCQHALALLFLLDEVNYSGNNIFDTKAQPDWLIEAFKDIGELRFNTNTHLVTTNHETISKGLAELELWLSDLLRSGLNRFKDKPQDYTNAMAHRLVDSDLPDLARDINKFALIPKLPIYSAQVHSKQGSWPELLLAEIGRLYALIQAFKRLDELPTAVQGDIYLALGMPQIDTTETISDQWYILGKTTEQQGKNKELRTWLYGTQSSRVAYVTRRYKANEGLNQHLLTGTTLEAELQFYRSQFPLRAEVTNQATTITSLNSLAQLNFTSIATAHESYRKAKAQNPWLRHFPMFLGKVTPAREQNKIFKGKSKVDTWTLHDQNGYQLPIVRNFKYGWHLLALGLSDQLNFLAEWNGYDLKPISLLQDEDMYDVQSFRGLT